jgi:hypothetical protein
MKPDLKSRFCERCPRKLDALPDGWCPLAVLRLKSLRTLGREATEEEEAGMQGCNWALDHQMSGYCWFKYESQYLSEISTSDADIAAALNISVDTVKKTAEKALQQIKDSKEIKEIRKAYGTEAVVPQNYSMDDETVYCE